MAERYEYQISADVAQFRRAMDDSARSAGSASREITDQFKRAGDTLSSSLGNLRNVLAGAFSVGAVVQFGRAIVASTLEAERSTALLNATLRSTGYAAGQSRADIETLVANLSKLSGFDDDPIREGVVSLLRFREISGQTFREAAQAAVDLAVATGTDVPSAFQRIGKALQDPQTGMKSLREVGVRLSEGQQELAQKLRETGDVAGSQRIVLEQLKTAVGGAGATGSDGLTGSTRSLANAWDDLLKNIGQTQIVGGSARATLDSLAAAANLANRLLTVPDSGLGGIIRTPDSAAPRTRVGELSEAEALALQGAPGRRVRIAEPAATDKEALKTAQRESAQLARLLEEGTRRQAELGANIIFGQFAEIAKAREEAGRELEKALQEGPEIAARQAEEQNRRLQSLLADTPAGKRSAIETDLGLLNDALISGRIDPGQYEQAFAQVEQRINALTETDPFPRIAESGKDAFRELIDAVNGFSRQVSNTFAEMVVEGEADFARLGKSFAKMLAAQTFQQYVAAPASQALGNAIASAFGGRGVNPGPDTVSRQIAAAYPTRDAGGPGVAGQAYFIGRRAQPELFVPDRPGNFYPAGSYPMGGVTVTNYIDSRTDLSSIAAINARTVRQIEDIQAMRARR